MRHLTAAFLLMALACSPLLAQDETAPKPPADNALSELENPLADAAEGEWIQYTISSENKMTGKMEMPLTQTIVGVDGDEIEVHTVLEMMGMKQEQTDTLDRSQNLLDTLLANLSQMGETEDVTIEESTVEDSTIEHAGKTYNTKKVFLSVSATVVPQPNMQIPITMKLTAHVCNDVPVTGLLFLDSNTTMTMGGQKMEIKTTQTAVDFGFEPKGDDKKDDKEGEGEF